QDAKGPLFIATPAATRLDEVATKTYRAAPDDVARIGFAVAGALDEQAPAVPDLSSELHDLAKGIANALKQAQRPVVIAGGSCNSTAIIHAAANVARALFIAGVPSALSFIVPECNSFGLVLMNGRPLSQAF